MKKFFSEFINDNNKNNGVISLILEETISDSLISMTIEDCREESNNLYKVVIGVESDKDRLNVTMLFELHRNEEDILVVDYWIEEVEDLLEQEINNDKKSFDIDYWSYNITYDQLARMMEAEKMIIPEMQRGYVWDHTQASRLIESILMGLPLPSVFLIKNDDGYVIVDGLQRVTTIHAFRYNIALPNSLGKEGFSLSGVDNIFKGKTYGTLNLTEKERFELGTINIIEFKQNKPQFEESMYTLFERLNSGGTSLSQQQIRNSVYYGEFNTLLKSESESEIGDCFNSKARLSLAPAEVYLRAIAIYEMFPKIKEDPKGSITYKRELNRTAEKYHMLSRKINRLEHGKLKGKAELKEQIDNLFSRISNAVDVVRKVFGDNSFIKYDFESKEFNGKFTPILFESMIAAIMLADSDKTQNSDEEIIRKYKELFRPSGEYENAFSHHTSKRESIVKRVETLQSVFFVEGNDNNG